MNQHARQPRPFSARRFLKVEHRQFKLIRVLNRSEGNREVLNR
jgi:hypothetical protein